MRSQQQQIAHVVRAFVSDEGDCNRNYQEVGLVEAYTYRKGEGGGGRLRAEDISIGICTPQAPSGKKLKKDADNLSH